MPEFAWVVRLSRGCRLLHAPNVLFIPGTASAEHLEGNVAAGAVTLDDATMAALDAVPTKSGDILLGPRGE